MNGNNHFPLELQVMTIAEDIELGIKAESVKLIDDAVSAPTVITTGGHIRLAEGMRFVIAKEEFLVGRSIDNDLLIKDLRISRRHAKIEVRPDESFTLHNLSTSNPTLLNGERLDSNEQCAMGSMGTIRLADIIDISFTDEVRTLRLHEVPEEITHSRPVNVLELSKVGRQFGTELAVHALVDVDLTLAPGEWLSITGPSGSGKSTLLNIIGCLDRPTSGTYLFDGINTAQLTDRERAGLRSRRIGFIFQSFHLLPHRSVLENVMLAEVYRQQDQHGRRERALAALERVGLGHRVDFLPTELSGGQRQRVAIARALVGYPSLLICDEPTGNLDSKTTEDILDLFETLNQEGLTLVIVTHDEHVAARSGRRVHIIDGTLTDITAGAEEDVADENIAKEVNAGADAVQEVVAKVDARRATIGAAQTNGTPLHDVIHREGVRRVGQNKGYGDAGATAPQAAAQRLGDRLAAFVAGLKPRRLLFNPFTIKGWKARRAQAVRKPRRAVELSGITTRDLIDEAIAGMFARPVRMVLTMLGIVIGITALVATIGLSRTAGNRITTRFDELAATEILVKGKSTVAGVDPKAIPWSAAATLLRLNGVAAAGTLSDVDIGNALVSSSPVRDPKNPTAFKLTIQAASPGLFKVVRAQLDRGRFLDEGYSQRMDKVAVLGPEAAQKLGIHQVDYLPAITIGDHVYLVIGVLRNVARQPDLLNSVIIPEGTAQRDFGLLGPSAVVVETRIGATSLIVRQARLALRPDDPGALTIEAPPEPKRVRDAVQNDLNVMFLLLGGLSLIVGAIGIGNITLVSVIERTGEIGLRRAIGATRWHIALQFLLESASMGIIGGILGAGIGILIVVAISAYQVWTPVLDPAAPFLAPLVGGGIGLISGVYPALRAAQLEPVEAFRN